MRENLSGGSLKLLIIFILLAANVALAVFAPSSRRSEHAQSVAPNEFHVARP